MSTYPILLRSIGTGIMLWGYKELNKIDIYPSVILETGGHWQFLTIQALAAACLTLIAGLLASLVPSVQAFHRAHRTLQISALPLSVVVTTIYWSLIFLFPSLILPPASSVDPATPASSSSAPPLARIPITMDLALHACPIVTLMIDFLIFQVPYSSFDVNYYATVIIAAAALWYTSFVEYCASHNKTFPYPFLTQNDFKGRVCIYIGATLIALLTFRALNKLHPHAQ